MLSSLLQPQSCALDPVTVLLLPGVHDIHIWWTPMQRSIGGKIWQPCLPWNWQISLTDPMTRKLLNKKIPNIILVMCWIHRLAGIWCVVAFEALKSFVICPDTVSYYCLFHKNYQTIGFCISPIQTFTSGLSLSCITDCQILSS